MTERRGQDVSPLSEFIAGMRDIYRRRVAASSRTDKLAIEREMTEFMRKCLGRSAWDATLAAQAAERAASPNVPRATRRRGRFAAPSKYSGAGFDRKMAAAGEGEE